MKGQAEHLDAEVDGIACYVPTLFSEFFNSYHAVAEKLVPRSNCIGNSGAMVGVSSYSWPLDD